MEGGLYFYFKNGTMSPMGGDRTEAGHRPRRGRSVHKKEQVEWCSVCLMSNKELSVPGGEEVNGE